MKKQIIERIARELLNEARRFRAIVRTAQPTIRTEAKANDAELAFEVDFKVRPGFSTLPTDADILDEVGSAIKENSSVGDTSKYADGNYYYIISPDKTDKKRIYLYNVYIFKKNRVWQNYPDFVDRSSTTQTTDVPITNANEPVIGKKNKPKNIKSITVTAAEGSVVRIGKSILLDSDKWLKSSQNNIKTYKPIQKSFAFINKVVNNQVDNVPAIDDKKVGEPKKTAMSLDNKTITADPNVIDAAKAATDTIDTTNPIKQTSQTSQKVPPRETSPVTTSIKSNTAVIIKSASPMFVYKDGKFTSINKQTQPDQQGTLIKLDASKNYAEIKLKNPPIDKLPYGYDQLKFLKPGKKQVVWKEKEDEYLTITLDNKNYIYRGYNKATGRTLVEPAYDGNSIPFWIATSELTMPPSKTIWIRKKDIK